VLRTYNMTKFLHFETSVSVCG